MPNNRETVCFSGHRTFSEGDDDRRLEAAVRAAAADGYRTFISGMAAGFDLAAARCVLRLSSECGLRLVCAVPFREHINDEAILAAADEVHVLAERYSHGAFYHRNEWMVERSGRLICWYDASSSRASSGTRHTVRTALASGLEIVNIFRSELSLF